MGNKKPSPPNHMAIQWHDYVQQEGEQSILTASLTAKASVVGRTGLMLLACGTGAWRVRSSMNAMAAKLGLVCAADIGLTSLEYTCFDGEAGFSQTLTLTSTGVNTAKLNRLERFVEEFSMSDGSLSGRICTSAWTRSRPCMGCILPVAWRWRRPWPAEPLRFCWAAAR